MLASGSLVLRRNRDNPIRIHFERNLNLGHATGTRGNANQLKFAQRSITLSQFALTLQNVNLHRRLAIRRRREDFALTRRDRGVRLNHRRHHAAQGFDAERQRRYIQQENVGDVAGQHSALNRSANGYDFIRIHALVPFLPEHILQGERPMAIDNRTLGRFHLDGIPPAPRGVPQVEVTFDIDANGLLHVTAKDKATNKEQSIRITSSSGLTKEEIEKMKQDAQAHSQEDKRRREEVDLKNQADTLVFQTRKQVKDFGDKMPANLKTKVESAADELDAAIKTGNFADMKAKMELLNTAWNEASSAMYQQTTAGAAGGPEPGPQPGGQAADSGKKDGNAVEDASFEVVDDKDKK